MRETRRDARSDAASGAREGSAATPGKTTLVSQLPEQGVRGDEMAGATAAEPQAAAAAPDGDGQSGTIDRVGGEPGEGTERGAGEGLEDRLDGGGGSGGSGSGGPPAATPTPAANLTVTTSFTSEYDQPNSLSPSPFGAMIPGFEFTGITWTVSGNTCNIAGRLSCHYPWGVNGGGRTDVASGTDAAVTASAHPSSGKKVWETIVDDLKPAAASPHKSQRTHYWSQSLTSRHERYHGTDDYSWVTSTGKPDAEAFVQSRTVSRGATGTDVTGVLESARRRVAQGSDAYYGVSLGHDSRPGEIRAYGDGRPHYQALADAVRTQGQALERAGTGGGGAGGGGGPGPGPGGSGGVGRRDAEAGVREDGPQAEPAPPGQEGQQLQQTPAQVAPTRDPQALIRELAAGRVDIGGTATEADKAVVVAELERFPLSALRLMVQANRRVVVCRNSITEVLTNLRGQTPRGWENTGKTWDDVPGAGDDGNGRTVIAVRNGRIPPQGDGHNAINLVMHEVAHGIDRSFNQSGTPEFQAARTADRASLSTYESQAGTAGLEETYAESFARFHAHDPNDATTYPRLHAYWAADPLARLVRP